MPAFRTIRLSIRRGCLVFATGGGQLFFSPFVSWSACIVTWGSSSTSRRYLTKKAESKFYGANACIFAGVCVCLH